MNVAQKIIKAHLVSGQMQVGEEIAIKIDSTLTQDSTGTMAYLQFEAMDIPKVKTKLSVAYIDHNTLQTGFENADDHRYIQTIAKKHGIRFSRAGNGICHQVNLERFGVPGWTLLGSDSHTPTCGALAMLAIGAGGLDVAVAMGGGEYYFLMPKVVGVRLSGKLLPMVSAKDIILELLHRVSVKGGVGKIFEYFGDGVATLTVPQRATIANMGAELGATTSIFPSDKNTLSFLKAQKREKEFIELLHDSEDDFDETIEIDLSKLKPLVAKPHSPDFVDSVETVEGIEVNQVAIGSCTNSSYQDMMSVAQILKGNKIAENVSLVISCGSKQVYSMLAKNGALFDIIQSGARILECACGPCIGMGQSPANNAISLRTFNRNFEGRSGTLSAKVYLVSPETAAVSAIKGVITDPRKFGAIQDIKLPEVFEIDDSGIIMPAKEGRSIEVLRGPNIKPFPIGKELQDKFQVTILTKLGDNVTTDDIMPSNASLLPYRSNIPYLSEFCLTPLDADFPKKAKAFGGGAIVAGSNYGQGSSREHAVLAPLQLGICLVIAKSYARIHKSNLINNGILPLEFISDIDYESFSNNEILEFSNLKRMVRDASKGEKISIKNKTTGKEIKVNLIITPRQAEILLAGGLLNYTRKHGGNK